MTFKLWTLGARLCIFSLYISHLLLPSQQASIAMWTILISKSWWWFLKPERSTSTLSHNIFAYWDYAFFCFHHTPIYIYIYIYIRGTYDKFTDFFHMGIKNCRRLWKIQYVIVIHLMRWLTNFYDFRFKWTPTAAIGIHPTKAWLSQLGNFKNSIWHFRRTICNKILF